MLIGARVIKTGIAVTVAMGICTYFGMEPALFAALSAVINLQPSLYQSFKNAKEQIMVHITGVSVAMVIGWYLGANPVTMGLATILVITICIKRGWVTGISMGVVAAIFVLDAGSEAFITQALKRSSTIFVGLFVAMITNYLITPPNYEKELKARLKSDNHKAINLFSKAICSFVALKLPQENGISGEFDSLAKELEITKDLLQKHDYQEKGVNDNYSHWFSYNSGVMNRAKEIFALIPQRLERREMAGNLPISPEFEALLAKLIEGRGSVLRFNNQMITGCIPIDSSHGDYWKEFSEIVDLWQSRTSGTYYTLALQEISLVAYEIRWVIRELEGLKFFVPKKDNLSRVTEYI